MSNGGLVHPVGLNSELASVTSGHIVAVFGQFLLYVIRVFLLDLGPELIHAEMTNKTDVHSTLVKQTFWPNPSLDI